MIYRAFTLLELVVALAIIVLLLAILLPAVQYARETARQGTCTSNVRQLIVALHQYEAAHGYLPPSPSWGGYGLHVAVLPYLEMEHVARRINPNVLVDFADPQLRSLKIPVFLCPSGGATSV
jgi:prepilin-type N-terminal cleavage/methylation domain-containing protein